jgi:hypothetical protein
VLSCCYSILLALSQTILANIVWPALYLIGRLLSIWVISLSLLVEFVFLWKPLRLGAKRAILADVAMNLASAAFGFVLIVVPWARCRSSFPLYFRIGCLDCYIHCGRPSKCRFRKYGCKQIVQDWLCKERFLAVSYSQRFNDGLAYGSFYFFPIKD